MIRNFCKSFLILIILLITITPRYAYADTEYGIGRTRTCSASNGDVEGLEFDPTSGGKDVQFDLDNPVCMAVILSSYALSKAALAVMNKACSTGGGVRVTPSPIYDAIDIAKGTYKCASTGNGSCCGSLGGVVAAFSAFLAEIGIIFGVAETVFDNTEICGASWMKPNVSKYDFSAANYKQEVQLRVNDYVRRNDTSSNGLSSANRIYREWFYNGKEFEDNPYQGSVCRDPTRAKDQWGNYPLQRYYLKGTEVGNYNCKQYLVLPGQSTPYNVGDMKEAYECCLNRSQNYICIDYTNKLVADNPPVQMQRTPTFCKKGENCTMMRPGYNDSVTGVHYSQIQNGGIWFEVQEADSSGSLLCAKTYSLCPYNFNVGGGSDYCDYYRDGKWNSGQGRWTIITQEQIDAGQCSSNSEIRNSDCTYNDKAGKCKNYCQYLVHCAKTSSNGFVYQSGLGSPYFAQACLDFVGDSQNNTGFNTGIIMGMQTHFTAPIAQCIKESLENLFYNRAGHSKCLNYGEVPDATGVCASGLYITDGNFTYKKGNKVKDNSFFQVIQNVMSLVIKMAITLAVVFYGINLLLWKNSLGEKKDILVFVFKIALVMYFCVGTAWQDVFFRGFYDSSMVFANMLFKIETMQDEKQRDGCQFGTISLQDGSQISSGTTYPAGKEYLAIWDTIDCKMMRYLGFGPQLTNANIASMVIATYFFGPIGIYFAMSIMIFGFFLVSLGIRALHIFISSAAAIILLIFISPMVIPCGMFARTKEIFNNWLSQLLSYCLQPMILFAYVAVFITIMDQTLIGSATFHGAAPTRTMSCEKTCVDANGDLVPYVGDQAPACDQQGQEIINPLDDSVACLLNFNGFGQWHAFEMIGVAVPIVTNLFEENIKQRMLTILKGALVMGLLYMFMDEIPGIISALIGGSALTEGKNANAASMMIKAVSMTKAVTERLGRAGAKVGGSAASTVSRAREYAGGKDKSVAKAEEKGSDSSGKRDGEATDSTASKDEESDSTAKQDGGGGEDKTA